ncbi:MAG: QueT transporter family protein [Candidatus Nezhaarchaeota archaeon]|nr:QueT transporter family protein [Candidatus Nezhaarchaeota archaeon]
MKRKASPAGTKRAALIGIYAALYAALVYAFAPISFYALQFRVAGVLRPAIAKDWRLAIGYALGVVLGNLVSPFVGAWELLFMPATSFVAGVLGYLAARLAPNYDYYVCGAVIAVIIPLSVSFMLAQLFNLPMLLTLPPLLVSEQTVNFIGATVFRSIERRGFVWWR